jgi:glycosyltransferase involved in cell wall biosynthesis/GT2 family glycosyltransferase/cytochrome c-type biogenesis protein CcmH/NrfG
MAFEHSEINRSLNTALRIGVDVRGLEVESSLRRGIGRYVCNLIRAMSAAAPNYRFILYGENAPWRVAHLAPLLALSNVRYTAYHPSFDGDIDVLLLTDPAPVLEGRKLLSQDIKGLPCATIFYDLIPLAFDEEYLKPNPRLRNEYFSRLDELERTVSHYLTISRFVADDVHSRLGISSERVLPIMGGLDEVFGEPPARTDVRSALEKFGITEPYFFYTGGADYRKNLHTLLGAFVLVRAASKQSVKLVLAGEFTDAWRKRAEESADFRGISKDILTLGYVTDEELRCLYAGAAAFVFPSLYEGFGLPALEAMASGCPVIASDGSSLKEIVGDAGILVNPESPHAIAEAMLKPLKDAALGAGLRSRGVVRARQFTWGDVADRALHALSQIAKPGRRVTAPSRRMRVVIQNRADAFDGPGGDTVVMERLFHQLRSRDVDVDVATGSPDLAGVDLVHLINLTLPKVGREVSENANRQHVPYVITALFEDWPLYLDRSIEAARLFKTYLESGRNEDAFRRGLQRLKLSKAGGRVDSGEIAAGAAALFACGETEAAQLRAADPALAKRIWIAPFGIETGRNIGEKKRAYISEALGLDRYILCCGRLETRKNQLMLLKALEDSDLPILFASGGFSYQPQYVELVAKFTRRGPVRTLGRVPTEMLQMLMAGALAHVLPSWYELPGLVTLEAASAGTAVVASEWGAIRDYLPGDLVHLCQPDDPDSIRAAVESALRAGPNPRAKQVADSFTWDAFGEATHRAYEQILSRRTPTLRPAIPSPEKHNTLTYPSVENRMNSSDSGAAHFDASIIIPVHNRAQLTQECIVALSGAETRANYELIIVDNASTDDTPRILQAIEGDVTVLRQSSNRGFAAACNLGARVATGEFLVFLNNDTQPQSGWLDALLECARSEKSAGVIGSRLLYPEGKVQHAGVAFNVNKIPYHVFQNFGAEHPAATEQRDMQAVTGACMMVSANLFRELSGFDEGYRNGFEDIDFCLRARASLSRVIYCPRSTVIHHEEASEGRKDHDRENLERFMQRWQEAVRADDTELLARHGYKITWTSGRGIYEQISANSASSDVTIEDAQKLYREGRLEEAAAALQSLIERRMVLGKEDTFETWQTLGNCLARMNRVDEAEKAYYEAIRLDEESDRPYLGLGALAMLQENWQAAMYGFMTALAKKPGTTRGEFGVALSMAVRNMHQDALEHFRRVLEREPFNQEALFYYYRSAVESAQPQIAIEPLKKYLAQHPIDTNFLFNLCGAYWKSGELTRAAGVCQQVLDLDPDHVAAREVMEHLQTTVREYA